MELIILIIKLLIRAADSRPAQRSFAPPPTVPQPPPPLPTDVQQQLARARAAGGQVRRPPIKQAKNPAAIARQAVSKQSAGRKPVAKPAVAVRPADTDASRAPVNASPATLIDQALKSPRNIAAALVMTDLLAPPASLRYRAMSHDQN